MNQLSFRFDRPNMPRQKSGKRDQENIEFARDQRKRANEFADIMWQLLRGRRCQGRKFRREYPIPPYTADFCCVELKLVVEVDGDDHFTETGRKKDQRRDAFLRRQGYEVIRFAGYDLIDSELDPIRIVGDAIDRIVARRAIERGDA